MTLHRIVLEGVWDGPDELVWIGWCCPGERARCSPPERPVETPLPGSAERYSVTKRDQIRQTADYQDSPGRIVRIAVLFFPDGTDQCGPATLASVLMYWGIPSEPAVFKAEIYRPQLGGT
jgi:hypothetical protein